MQMLNKETENVEQNRSPFGFLLGSIELEPSRPPAQYGAAGVTVGALLAMEARRYGPEFERAGT